MSAAAIRSWAENLVKEEKKFLMQHYASLLVGQVEGDGELGEKIVESLLVAQPYAEAELASRIADLLQSHGYVGELQQPSIEEDSTLDIPSLSDLGDSLAESGDEEDSTGLFDREDLDDEGGEEVDFDLDDDDEISEAGNLFATEAPENENDEEEDYELDDEPSEDSNLFATEKPEDNEEEMSLFKVDEEEEDEDGISLFEFDDAEDVADREKERLFGQENSENEDFDDPANHFAGDASDDFGSESDNSSGISEDQGEEDIAAEGPLNEDIPGKKGVAYDMGSEQKETPGFTPIKGHEQKETPGFNPTKGHEQKETPGFNPTKGHEQKESKIGKRKKGNNQANQHRSIKGKQKASQDSTTTESLRSEQSETEKEPQTEHAPTAANSEAEAFERDAIAKEKLEGWKKGRQTEMKTKEEEKETATDEVSTAELLSKITYQVSFDDLENKLGMHVIPEDRARLDNQLAKKMADPPVRALLEGAEEEGLTLAMVPRLPRYVRGGQLCKVTGANLVRSFPHFFENVQQIVLKLRNEPFFLQESPELNWSIFSCEVLSDSREKTYMQQKQLLKQHAQRYQSTELRVQRRNMIEALYDLIIIKLVHDHNLLSETVELTESKMGRQNLAFINFGENGIRISDIGRQQTHAQLGVCPSW